MSIRLIRPLRAGDRFLIREHPGGHSTISFADSDGRFILMEDGDRKTILYHVGREQVISIVTMVCLLTGFRARRISSANLCFELMEAK